MHLIEISHAAHVSNNNKVVVIIIVCVHTQLRLRENMASLLAHNPSMGTYEGLEWLEKLSYHSSRVSHPKQCLVCLQGDLVPLILPSEKQLGQLYMFSPQQHCSNVIQYGHLKCCSVKTAKIATLFYVFSIIVKTCTYTHSKQLRITASVFIFSNMCSMKCLSFQLCMQAHYALPLYYALLHRLTANQTDNDNIIAQLHIVPTQLHACDASGVQDWLGLHS